jgi:hypothetical protein
MKKFDTEFDDDLATGTDQNSDEENYPTAVYTVYNVHGEPIGHRLYSYQPVYEPEEDELVENVKSSEYEDSNEFDDLSHVTVLKGGLFPDRKIGEKNAKNINRLKHDYFERYVDKRRKRFLNTKTSSEPLKDDELDLEADSTIQITTSTTATPRKARLKRYINNEETDREAWTSKPTRNAELINDVTNDLLKVIPLENNDNKSDSDLSREMAVIPLQYHSTNSTEVDNILDKRDKRTSRKTDRLNQTTAAIPKT